MEPTSRRRVLLIGLDAADPTLLCEAMERGELPALRQIRDSGAWGFVSSPPGFGSGAVWPSFATGVSPSKHGRYFYRQVGPGRYEAARFEARQFDTPSFWEKISAAGRRVAVFDVPKMGLSQEIDGVEVVDWLAHGPVYHELRTNPASFAAELVSRFGSDPLPQCDLPGGRDARAQVEFLDILSRRVETKGEASRHFLGLEKWDLFITVFADPHCVGHQSWHVRDPAHPQHDAEAHAQIHDPVLAVYRAIDRAIGEMLEGLDDDVCVIVLSCTGMGPNYTGNRLLDEVLRRLEGLRKPAALDAWGRLKGRVKLLLPRSLRRRGRQLSRRVDERVSHADRMRRRCFAVPHNDMTGAIRMNLEGRELQGHVHPDEVDALFERLRSDLLELRNLDTGEPVVADVVRTAGRDAGRHQSRLPDFFVVWRRTAPIERVGSAKIGEIVCRHRGNRTGDHRADSIFFARGSSVPVGRIDGVSILDFASTIATLLGVEFDGSDGKPIAELAGHRGVAAQGVAVMAP